jgi:hypothetical protein
MEDTSYHLEGLAHVPGVSHLVRVSVLGGSGFQRGIGKPPAFQDPEPAVPTSQNLTSKSIPPLTQHQLPTAATKKSQGKETVPRQDPPRDLPFGF